MAHRLGRPHRQGRPAQRIATAIVAAALTTTGCQGMAATQGSSTAPPADADPRIVADWPLRFMRHNFGIATYAVQECLVVYADRPHTSGPRPALGDVHPNSLKIKTANHLMIRNFPPPAVVKWKSRDGTPLEAEVDIGEIFKNELVVHETPREEMSEYTPMVNPDVIMEINDRTINVYMKAFISLKAPRVEGNPHSDYRSDLVLAWSKTY
ncbi:hypothetical protein LDO31_13085 [Luteimonas sp. XNQY3]|nr:hypothetical protein [Luteimonas sp. XNQY3]MCD9007152.1 hypothetical protein [Luteimonas sp. XNQY3]